MVLVLLSPVNNDPSIVLKGSLSLSLGDVVVMIAW